MIHSKRVQISLVALLIIMTGIIYMPGLKGGYVFDDLHSLSKLSIINEDLSFEKIFDYIGASKTGPLKRPVSVMSFLIDGQKWPTFAFPFKRTNLVIHLINGLLLFLIVFSVFKAKLQYRQSAFYISLFASACWILHPFMVSTTLYIVQRMAMLPAMFSLLGMLLYVRGRLNWHQDIHRKAQVQMFSAVLLMVPLAVLSKENGILLIFHIAILEKIICANWLQLKPLNNHQKWMLIRLPVLALVSMLILKFPGFLKGYEVREFTLLERLMSETRAIFKYLYHLWVPSYFTEGVFTDGFKKSTSLFQPISTLYSLAGLLILAVTVFLLRKRFIWLWFAAVFFAIAHILESSFVPLELYYEHRNYLASLFMFVPLSLLIHWATQQSKVFLVVPFLIIATLVFQTVLRVDIWSDNLRMHYLTMQKYPESIRARTLTASYLDNLDRQEEALDIIAEGVQLHENLELRFNQASLKCNLKILNMQDINQLVNDIKRIDFTKDDVRPLGNLMAKLLIKDCMDDNAIVAADHMLQALKVNKNVIDGYGEELILYLEGTILIEQHQFERAATAIKNSFAVTSNDYISINNAVIKFISKRQTDIADQLLSIAENRYAKEYEYKVDWSKFGEKLRSTRVVIDQIKKQNEAINNHSGEK